MVRADFEERFPKSGKRDKHCTANRAKVTQEHFDRLPEEDQKRFTKEAKADHAKAVKDWKEALNGKPSNDPRD